MSHYSIRSQPRRPRTSPLVVDNSGGFAKMFSSLKKKAVALVSTSPSPSFPPSSLPPGSPHARSAKRNSRDRRPHTSPNHRAHSGSSLRKHGLANHPRPPAIRPITPRRDSTASSTSTSSFSSATTSSDSSVASSSPSTPISSPSSSPIPSSSKGGLRLDHKQQISHLQDQISALQRAISPLPPTHHHPQRISIIPEESEGTNSTLIDTDSESTYSTDSVLPASSEQQHSQAAKRSSVLLALYPSSRPSTSDKKDCDPFAKDTVQVQHALPSFGTSVALKGTSGNSRSRPVSSSSKPSPSSEILVSSENHPSTPVSAMTALATPRATKRSSIITLGQSTIPPPVTALPQVPTSECPEYQDRNVKHLTRKEMATESDAEADAPLAPSLPKDKRQDWTLCLGALEFYMDMQDPIERPSHPAPPTVERLSAQVANSYLDMSPVLPAFVQPSNSSIRSVRSRSKTRVPIIHSPPIPQAEFDRGVYESPRPAPLPPPLSLMSLSPVPSPSPSASYSTRRSTPSSSPSPAPSHSSSHSSRSYFSSASPSPSPSASSRRRHGHKQTPSEASQSTITSSMSFGTVRNYHMPSSHAYAAGDEYHCGPQHFEPVQRHTHPRTSLAYSFTSSASGNTSITTTTTSLTVTSTTSSSTIGKRASRLIGFSVPSRKDKEKDECTSGWF